MLTQETFICQVGCRRPLAAAEAGIKRTQPDTPWGLLGALGLLLLGGAALMAQTGRRR